MISRRHFLASAGVAALASVQPGGFVAALEKESAAGAPIPTDWAAIKAEFDLNPDYAHLSSFYVVSHPRVVRKAIADYAKALDGMPYGYLHHAMFSGEASNLQLRQARVIAEYIEGNADEIAFVGNTTTGLALLHNGLPLKTGDDVLTTEHDHYVHHESIRMACERSGASWRKVALFDRSEDATAAGMVGRLKDAIRSNTRVIGVTWVHSSTGIRLPIREMAEMVADVNRTRDEEDHALLVVDGVHGIGCVDEAIATLGCDYFCAGTHKWICAPRGTGIVWAKPDRWALVKPTVPTFSNYEPYRAWMEEQPIEGPTTAATFSPGGFHAYEHMWAMGEAFRMHREIGRKRIADRIQALNDRCKAGLVEIPRVALRTPRDPAVSAGIICFEVDGMSEEAVVKHLLEHNVVASTSPYKTSHARLAPSLVNDEKDVDRAIAAVRAVARS